MSEQRELTNAEADALRARHGIIASRLPLTGHVRNWQATVGHYLATRPTYAEAVAAVCKAAGLNMTVAPESQPLAPDDHRRLQHLARYMGLLLGCDIIDGIRAAWDAKCVESADSRALVTNLLDAVAGWQEENAKLTSERDREKTTAQHQAGELARLNARVYELLTEKKRLSDETARLDSDDPRASKLQEWCRSHSAIITVAPGHVSAGRYDGPTAREAMDAYEAQQKPKADPECVELIRWWRTHSYGDCQTLWRYACVRFGLTRSQGACDGVCGDTWAMRGVTHTILAGTQTDKDAFCTLMAEWLRTSEAKLAAEELDREGQQP